MQRGGRSIQDGGTPNATKAQIIGAREKDKAQSQVYGCGAGRSDWKQSQVIPLVSLTFLDGKSLKTKTKIIHHGS